MSADLLRKKYSQALFEVAEASGSAGQISHELQQISKVFSQDENINFFSSPHNTIDTKLALAKSALEGRCSKEVFNFISLVVENERVAQLAGICDAYQALVRTKSGETEGVLSVPGEVSGGFRERVEEELSRSLNKKVRLKIEKDASLISGYRATVGGWTVDDSAQFHLNKIKENISQRNN